MDEINVWETASLILLKLVQLYWSIITVNKSNLIENEF